MFEDVSKDLPAFDFHVAQYRSGPHENFHFIIGDPATRRASIVDPAFNVDRLIQSARKDGWTVDTAWLTHAHWDHIGGLDDAVRLGVEHVVVGAAAAQAGEVQEARKNGAKVTSVRGQRPVPVGRLPAVALPTPGHQPEALCFAVDNATILTGDTLFIDSCGRTDFPGGDTDAMFRSMQLLRGLNPDLVVLPGHDYATHRFRTLGQQLAENPALAVTDRAAFDALPFLRG